MRESLHIELVKAFNNVNIPHNKLDHPTLREYLQTNIKNIGQLPNSANLRRDYLLKVFDFNQEKQMRVKMADSVVLVTDEASYVQDRFVLHVVFILPVTK